MVRKSNIMTNSLRQRFTVATVLLASLLLAGCHTDMWRQPSYRPYAENGFFDNRQSSRPLVEGTVSTTGLRLRDDLYTGYQNGKQIKTIPVDAVKSFVSPKAMLLEGQSQYGAYCYPCHGANGNGNGFISIRGKGYWQKQPASYHTDRLRKVTDGYLYDVIVNGHGVMYGYATRIQDVNDRWAIVAYIRALQSSQNRPASSVSPSELSAD